MIKNKTHVAMYVFSVFTVIATIEGVVLSAVIMKNSWFTTILTVMVPLVICSVVIVVDKKFSLWCVVEQRPLIGFFLCCTVGFSVLLFERYSTPSWGIKPVTGTMIMAFASVFLAKRFGGSKVAVLSMLMYLATVIGLCTIVNMSVAGCVISVLSVLIVAVASLKQIHDWRERIWPIMGLVTVVVVIMLYLFYAPYSIFDWFKDEVISPSINTTNTMGSAVVRMLFRQTGVFGPKQPIEFALDMVPWSELLKNYVYEDGYIHSIALARYGWVPAVISVIPYLGIIMSGAILVKHKSGLEFYCALFALLWLSFYIVAYSIQCCGICAVRVGEPLLGRDMVTNIFMMLSILVITKRSDEYMPL